MRGSALTLSRPTRHVTLAAVLILAAACVSTEAAPGPIRVSPGIIQNDTVWRDTAGNEIWCNGGHIIREGDVFYWAMNQSLAIFELSKDFLRIERKLFEGFDHVNGNTNLVPREHSSREASHILKVGDIYYWFSSGLVGWNSSVTMYSTAKALAGPWSDVKLLRTDPPSNDSFKTQHDFVIPVTGSESATYVYVGDRYSQWTKHGPGRNIFLPLLWENGEPLLRWRKDWKIDAATGRAVPITESR